MSVYCRVKCCVQQLSHLITYCFIMANYVLVVVSVSVLKGALSQTTDNTTPEKPQASEPYKEYNDDKSGSGGGLGTTGLVILLLSVALVFMISLIVIFLMIHRRRKRKLEGRANRASYINHGYENTEGELFLQHSSSIHSDSGSQKSGKVAPPVKPTRRSSSKKSQNAVNYENIEIGSKKPSQETDYSSKSLPRNVTENVNLVVPNIAASKSKGSSIPFIDASRETLDRISEKQSEENIAHYKNENKKS